MHAHRRPVGEHQVGADAEERALPVELGGRAAGRPGTAGVATESTPPSARYLLSPSTVARASSAVPVSGFADDHDLRRVGLGDRVDHPYPVGDPAAQARDVVAQRAARSRRRARRSARRRAAARRWRRRARRSRSSAPTTRPVVAPVWRASSAVSVRARRARRRRWPGTVMAERAPDERDSAGEGELPPPASIVRPAAPRPAGARSDRVRRRSAGPRPGRRPRGAAGFSTGRSTVEDAVDGAGRQYRRDRLDPGLGGGGCRAGRAARRAARARRAGSARRRRTSRPPAASSSTTCATGHQPTIARKIDGERQRDAVGAVRLHRVTSTLPALTWTISCRLPPPAPSSPRSVNVQRRLAEAAELVAEDPCVAGVDVDPRRSRPRSAAGAP